MCYLGNKYVFLSLTNLKVDYDERQITSSFSNETNKVVAAFVAGWASPTPSIGFQTTVTDMVTNGSDYGFASTIDSTGSITTTACSNVPAFGLQMIAEFSVS